MPKKQRPVRFRDLVHKAREVHEMHLLKEIMFAVVERTQFDCLATLRFGGGPIYVDSKNLFDRFVNAVGANYAACSKGRAWIMAYPELGHLRATVALGRRFADVDRVKVIVSSAWSEVIGFGDCEIVLSPSKHEGIHWIFDALKGIDDRKNILESTELWSPTPSPAEYKEAAKAIMARLNRR
jgi:hypothetical protein